MGCDRASQDRRPSLRIRRVELSEHRLCQQLNATPIGRMKARVVLGTLGVVSTEPFRLRVKLLFLNT